MEARTERSPMNGFPVIKWLRSRFDNTKRRNPHYLFSPEELVRQREIQRIFTQFDSDGSGGLSREEIFNMFQGFDIDVPLEKINQLYDSVERNLKELDLLKFKECALSERSNQVFTDIINCTNQQGYMPTKFTEMITYLVYLSKREDLMKKIKDKESPGQNRVESMRGLLRLQELAGNNKEVNSQREKLKSSLKARFNRVWNRVVGDKGLERVQPSTALLVKVRDACNRKRSEMDRPHLNRSKRNLQ